MASAAPRPTPDSLKTPPLQAGDCLTRDEFERRYDAMPYLKKAELIDGVVYMPSPVRFDHHANPHFDLIGWLARYACATPGVQGGDNASLRLDLANEPQPDAFLMILHELGGQARIDEDDYVVGGPEFIGEVAASSVSFDLHHKLSAYERNRVREYVVWRVIDRAVDWFVLHGEHFQPLPAAEVLKSTVFPGLWLDPAALVARAMAQVAKVVDQGIAQPEHAAFVQQLQQRQSNRARQP